VHRVPDHLADLPRQKQTVDVVYRIRLDVGEVVVGAKPAEAFHARVEGFDVAPGAVDAIARHPRTSSGPLALAEFHLEPR
jgi:hypothetical protein